MNINLYKTSAKIQQLFNAVDPETGELPENVPALMHRFKYHAVSAVAQIMNAKAEIQVRKEHIKKLQDDLKAVEKRTAAFEKQLEEAMLRSDITEIQAKDFSFKAKLHRDRDEKVDVYDERLLPKDLLRVVPERYEPDKVAIRNLLKTGKEVQGARLIKKNRLEIK